MGSSPSLGTTVSICSEVQFQLVSISPGKCFILGFCWTNSQHTAARHRFLQQESALTSKDFEQAVPPPDGFSAFGPGRGRDRPGIPTFQGTFPFQQVVGNMLRRRHVWVEWDPPLSRRRALENRALVPPENRFQGPAQVVLDAPVGACPRRQRLCRRRRAALAVCGVHR